MLCTSNRRSNLAQAVFIHFFRSSMRTNQSCRSFLGKDRGCHSLYKGKPPAVRRTPWNRKKPKKSIRRKKRTTSTEPITQEKVTKAGKSPSPTGSTRAPYLPCYTGIRRGCWAGGYRVYTGRFSQWLTVYNQYKGTSGLIEWKIDHVFHSIFTYWKSKN